MGIIQREILSEAKLLLTQFRALCIVGPRQSGKTTLSRLLFKQKPYVSLENPSVQVEAESNPEAFLRQFPNGAILDEVQRVPDIFRYLQGILDENKKRGQFILTGSNNFLLQEKISQSLAGRAGYLQLLPLSYAELYTAGRTKESIHKFILAGGYPEIWDQELIPQKWMTSYVQTYIQRDVRSLRNITNLGDFTRFVMLCAARAGQLINREDMARTIGVDTKTIQAWLGILESSYIIYLLQPWYNNMNKRIVKSPKLYFYDTGLLCHLLGIHSQSTLASHQSYGNIFENWIITEVKKNRFNKGVNEGMYFYRDSTQNEVDLLVEKDGEFLPVEIKSAKKVKSEMFTGLRYWLRHQPNANPLLVYGGNDPASLSSKLNAISWKEIGAL